MPPQEVPECLDGRDVRLMKVCVRRLWLGLLEIGTISGLVHPRERPLRDLGVLLGGVFRTGRSVCVKRRKDVLFEVSDDFGGSLDYPCFLRESWPDEEVVETGAGCHGGRSRAPQHRAVLHEVVVRRLLYEA